MVASKRSLTPALLLTVCHSAAAFTPSPVRLSLPTSARINLELHAENDYDESTPMDTTKSRRKALQTMSVAFLSSLTAASQANAADSEIFKPNPLTNKALEQMRIWNQDEADNIKYGGELASASDKPAPFDQYVQLLQPILSVEYDLAAVDRLLKTTKASTKEEYAELFAGIQTVLAKSQFDKVNFKKAFNAFADNIYYSDPDRANLYLGGGAVPKTSQSIAYLLRNDVLTCIEDMRAEVAYLLKEVGKKGGSGVSGGGESITGDLDLEEIFGLSKIATGGMVKYLDLVPPQELEVARSKFLLPS